MLKVEHITKDFFPPLPYSKLLRLDFKCSQPTRALEDLSFSLGKGQVLAVLGPNGAGKTTLLKIIATLIFPDKGAVFFNDFQLGRDDEKIKSCLGLITEEERSFYWRLTARQNLDFFAALFGLDKKSAKARTQDLLTLFEVDDADKRFDCYSTGMKKRFALIRGLLHDPQLLLFDEPTKSLDYVSACRLRDFVREFLVKKQNKTVIFTTHQMEEANDVADLFLILEKGKMCAFGTLDELRSKVNDPAATLNQIFIHLTGATEND